MGHMKDLDRRIRQGGDDAMMTSVLAAVGELLPRWISVEERLPEAGQSVLVWHVPDVHLAWLNYVANGVAYFVRDTHYNFEPTHWMPLPEPPTTDKQRSSDA